MPAVTARARTYCWDSRKTRVTSAFRSQDWGVGFDLMNVQRHKRGLKGVRDLVAWLGGSVAIDSQPGMGTCITVEIPLSRETGSNVMVRASNRA